MVSANHTPRSSCLASPVGGAAGESVTVLWPGTAPVGIAPAGAETGPATVPSAQDAHLVYCEALTFEGAIASYLEVCVSPPQWNTSQRVAYAIAREYEDLLGPVNTKETRDYLRKMYNGSMRRRFGPAWRSLRKSIPGSAVSG